MLAVEREAEKLLGILEDFGLDFANLEDGLIEDVPGCLAFLSWDTGLGVETLCFICKAGLEEHLT
jgi:hypothetical protein